MVKRTHKTWKAEEIQVVQNCDWTGMSNRQKSQFSKSLERTVSSIDNKYRSLHIANKALKSAVVDFTQRDQKVTKSTFDKFINSILKNAKSATIAKDLIHIYFK
tara:strand:- start:1480 stop:1791 length:312 start_codon:yes stop_codon:yes gene_type:complete